MKPPAWRQAPDCYPVRCTIESRYTDEDRLGHINNIAIATYYDEARSRFTKGRFAAIGSDQVSRIVTADSRVTYLAEVFHGDVIEVRTGILRIGTASFELGQAMFVDARCVGLCTTTIVQATARGSLPLSPAMRGALEGVLVRAPQA